MILGRPGGRVPAACGTAGRAAACGKGAAVPASSYLDYSGRDDVLGGGVRMIPVTTPKGTFSVWTKRIGNNPGLKVLLLHGGPGATHEYLEAFDSFLPAPGIEYYYYDQLGSGLQRPARGAVAVGRGPASSTRSSRSARPSAWTRDNFFLYGQSWGGILAIEYALAHQQHLQRPDHLEHDGQHPGVQRVRREGADAGDGPGRAGRDQGLRGSRRHREPALHGAADRAPLRHSTCCGCRRTSGRTRCTRGFAHINPAIYVSDAGPERAGHQRGREAGALGPDRGPGARSTCRRW